MLGAASAAARSFAGIRLQAYWRPARMRARTAVPPDG